MPLAADLGACALTSRLAAAAAWSGSCGTQGCPERSLHGEGLRERGPAAGLALPAPWRHPPRLRFPGGRWGASSHVWSRLRPSAQQFLSDRLVWGQEPAGGGAARLWLIRLPPSSVVGSAAPCRVWEARPSSPPSPLVLVHAGGQHAAAQHPRLEGGLGGFGLGGPGGGLSRAVHLGPPVQLGLGREEAGL